MSLLRKKKVMKIKKVRKVMMKVARTQEGKNRKRSNQMQRRLRLLNFQKW